MVKRKAFLPKITLNKGENKSPSTPDIDQTFLLHDFKGSEEYQNFNNL